MADNSSSTTENVKQPRSSFNRTLISLVLIVTVAPCAAIWWFAAGQNAFFRVTLPVFPQAQFIDDAKSVYGANTAIVSLYFWTDRPLSEVRSYYETFTLPFTRREYGFSFVKPEHYRVAFNPYGGAVPVVTNEFSREHETIDPNVDSVCYYQIPQQCVEIELIEFQTSETVILRPPPGPMRVLKRLMSEITNLRGGTEIYYSYFESSMS